MYFVVLILQHRGYYVDFIIPSFNEKSCWSVLKATTPLPLVNLDMALMMAIRTSLSHLSYDFKALTTACLDPNICYLISTNVDGMSRLSPQVFQGTPRFVFGILASWCHWSFGNILQYVAAIWISKDYL
jgi:hypothetical protein